ncbi:proton-conducting transporter transmembrane domain-containing protein [Alicyclobacillus fastidiosus]|uniref:Proton-conducting transporter membrane subunit n=1 Tax=Alicyclobacillus fastidiosus TaxID=392011 RepID=A0ABV5AI39_9BACL|nr:proton-conducting transporter membrane subunit [Alicyclobacillus fastidiosus]WEH10077.1 proton-conducting transporter membrane subunit [Alicyclobacillus fastidiosus]
MSSSSALDIAILCVAICLFVSFLVATVKRLTVLGHVTGILTSLGFVVSGLIGLFHPSTYVSIGHGAFAFTTLSFRMNAVAGFFVLLIGIVGLFAAVYGIGYVREYNDRKSASLLVSGVLIFIATMVSVVLAGNVFTFLVSWECMSVVSFLLVIYEHEQREVQRAGFIYVVMTHIGTVFLTISFLILAYYSNSFSFQNMDAIQMPIGMKTLVFLFALIGFGTKAGLVPLHIWLPRAHPVAPSHVSALMSGVMIKMAMYGFILVVFQYLKSGPIWWGVLVACVGAVTALLGILHALGQRDQKRMLAYSSIENMGIIFMGLGVSLILMSLHEPTLATFALLASLVHAFNHALFKSLLFLGAGAVLSTTHTKDMDRLGGIIRSMPWTAAFTLVGALSICAMPPFNGFIGEWMLFQSVFGLATSAHDPWVNVFAVLIIGALTMTGALVAMAFVRSFGTTFLALPRSEYAQKAHEVDVSMRIGMAGLAGLCILTGVFSSRLFEMFGHTVQEITGAQLAKNPMGLAFYNLGSTSAHLSILPVLFTSVAALILLWLVIRLGGRRISTVREETWACGGTLTPMMTYTASGYSKPIRIAFQKIIRPSRTLDRTEGSFYFPAKYAYISKVSSFAEVYMYQPVVQAVLRTARIVRGIQNGQVQSYLAYLFITLIVVLLLVK